jgi:hypothetical protein
MADVPVTPPSVTALPTAPNRATQTNPQTYSNTADAWAAALPTWTAQLVALGANVEFNAESAYDSAGEAVVSAASAAAQVPLATAQVALAQTAASNAAASAAFKGAWDDQTGAATKPYSVSHEGRFWLLINNLADVTLSEPGVTGDWESVPVITVQDRTSNIILGATDLGSIIRYTAGGFPQTFESAALLTDNWFVTLKNGSTGNVPLDFFGTETCDGVATFVMYPGEMRLIIVNAAKTGFDSFVMQGFEVTFDSSGTFTKPPGYQAFEGIAWSAGASGDRDASLASGGHGGGAFPFVIATSEMDATETITIGAGGAGRTTNGASNPGGNTSIGSLIVVKGATATQGGAISADGGTTHITSVNNGNNAVGFEGASQGATSTANSVWGGACAESDGGSGGGNSIYGGAAGGSHDGTLRAAGTSVFGGNGGAAGDATNGADGEQPGGGGGATRTGTQSGAGGDGRVVMRGKF